MRKRISKYKHLHSNRFRYLSSSIPPICASGLLLVAGLMVNPLGIGDQTFATSIGEATNPGNTDGTPVAELKLSSTNLVKPSTTNSINYISTGLTVTANNVDHYGIYVQSANNSSNLTSGSTVLSGVGANVAPSGFGDNTWGYAIADGTVGEDALSGLTYNTLPAASSTSSAVKSGTTASEKPFTLAFAAKFASDATPGHYKGNLVVSMATTPEVVTNTLSEISSMQELTPEVCRESQENETRQLVDTRDGKSYWVAKLKDGNCWMTQNLDLDLKGKTLTVSDSDVTQDWSGAKDIDSAFWRTTSDSIGWYDPGEKIVSGEELVDAGDADKHYLVGNYYSWVAATAGSGAGLEEDGQIAPDSICPKNWSLPLSGNFLGSFNNVPGSYYHLLNQYGLANPARFDKTLLSGAPFYFVQAGNTTTNSVYYLGKSVSYPSSVVGTAKGKNYTLYISDYYNYMGISWPDQRYGSSTVDKGVGRPVRCVVSSAISSGAVNYKISYDVNGGSDAIPEQSYTSADSQTHVIDLYENIPTRSGYSFRGWSTIRNGGVVYSPGNNITLRPNHPEITLYAVWQPISNGLTSVTTMQALTKEVCAQTTTPTMWDDASAVPTTQLQDSRDGKTYWVAKLADGNCWMTQNLDYDDPSSTRRDVAKGEWTADNALRQYWDPGEKVAGDRVLVDADSSTDKHLLVGNYYSWAAATNGSGNGLSTLGDNATGSICPSGWRLPTSTQDVNGSFERLSKMVLYPADLLKSPYYFTTSGGVISQFLQSTGYSVEYWSSTVRDGEESYTMYDNGTDRLVPNNSKAKSYGYPIRCLVLGS